MAPTQSNTCGQLNVLGGPRIFASHSPLLITSTCFLWTYNATRDTENTALSHAQCALAFPDLNYEIDRAKSYWQKRGHRITQQDTNIAWRPDGAFRLLIVDNQLRILETKGAWMSSGYRYRTHPTLHQIYRALLGATAAGEMLPNIEFAVTVDDMSLIPAGGEDDTRTIWAYARRLNVTEDERLWLIPEFSFFTWPPIGGHFSEMQRKARVYDAPVRDKIHQLVWRGAIWTNGPIREGLVAATADKPWANVAEASRKNQPSNLIPTDEMCRWEFLAHTEGRSWSGRLLFLLNCNSIPVVHDLKWTTIFYHLLKPSGPEQNYMPVRRDWSDLEEKITHFLANPDEAQRIADNAVAQFRSRYTSPAAEACYWRNLIRGWSEVAFDPEVYETVTVEYGGKTVEKQQLRGVAFEEFTWIPSGQA
ncbi:glycosyl transferase family 90-domain-containing protein [Neohortaea acidophila]|uniref:Glycosyl transferase family 90-domain-containing protein n=1 Tax=Neohortaea acidophila TaxID=245834 RepID=A0A6A6Q560_9PEZI|nr:glycosyl transferase family 90-domain-containing protein [Neohortaea acidophila]KAF2486557.1 glycosyl transferase family 90-domain-containing protein [Neohortaea acidophila]